MSSITRSFIAVISLILSISSLFTGESNSDSPRLIAHRGFSSAFTENTPEAFLEAYNNGFDGVELDVYEGADGTVFVHHDASLKRMTGKDLYIWNLTLEKRDDYLIDSRIPVPTLEEALTVAASRKGELFIHIKEKKSKGYEVKESMLRTIEDLLRGYRMTDRTTVFADRRILERFLTGREGDYQIHFGLIMSQFRKPKLRALAAWCKDHGVLTSIYYDGDDPTKLVTFHGKKSVKIFHDQGIRIGLYTANTAEDLEKAKKAGADFVFSDWMLSKLED